VIATTEQEILDLVDASARIGMAPSEWLAVVSPDDASGGGFPDILITPETL